MFTGLIEEVGAVTRRSGADLAIMAEVVLEDMQVGDSIAVDGACLTVVEFNEDALVVQVSQETYNRTTLGRLKPGHAVNLERAMMIGDRFGGHMVQGHVDGVGKIAGTQDQGEFALWRFRAPAEVSRYLVQKGSVTIDGISLAVVDPAGDEFSVALIPETLRKTTLHTKRVGDPVNMEADMIGKHILHYIQGGAARGGLTSEYLREHGFA
jgi:riboflavin synthase